MSDHNHSTTDGKMFSGRPDGCASCGNELDDNYGGVGLDGPLCSECWSELPLADVVDDDSNIPLDTDTHRE